MAIGTNYNADQAKNSLKDPVNGKRQQTLRTDKKEGLQNDGKDKKRKNDSPAYNE